LFFVPADNRRDQPTTHLKLPTTQLKLPSTQLFSSGLSFFFNSCTHFIHILAGFPPDFSILSADNREQNQVVGAARTEL
jgi:hypothetical protein